jgi:hypothetical protein
MSRKVRKIDGKHFTPVSGRTDKKTAKSLAKQKRKKRPHYYRVLPEKGKYVVWESDEYCD